MMVMPVITHSPYFPAQEIFTTMSAANQGLTGERYTFVPRTLIFITRRDQVLLIKGAAHKRLWANLYNGIGGHIERGESVRDSAIREVNEETGLIVQDLQFCGTINVDVTEKTGVCIFIFKGECSDGEPLPSQEGLLEWVNFEEIHRLPLVEDLYVLLPRVLAFTPETRPFFGYFFYDENDQLGIYLDP